MSTPVRVRPQPPGSPESRPAVTNETDQPSDEATAPTIDALIGERRKKREALADRGINPYPSRFDRTAEAGDLHERHPNLEPDTRTGEQVRLAGRVTAVRRHGKLSFATLTDTSGSIQLLLQSVTLWCRRPSAHFPTSGTA
jgi:lysyl-tRNA synthetase class 2